MQNSILTNMSLIKIQNNLNYSQNNISISLKRMASGVKLNNAKDNAADYTISSKMENKLSSLNNATNNISHGQTMLLQMDKTLENMLKKVNKIQALALEASNTAYSKDERIAIQNEIDQLRREVYREKEIAKYGDNKIFEADDANTIKPYAYEVEYIESKGDQYIDTGFICNKEDNYKIVFTGDFKENTNGWMGANAFLQVQFKNGTIGLEKGTYGTLTGNDTISISFNNQTESLNLNGEDIYSVNWSSYSGKDVKIGIFKLGSNNDSWYNSTNHTKGKMNSYQLYKDDELVLDLKPVVDHNGKVCMYDNLSGKMYYDKKGGDFIAGPAVIPPSEIINTITLQIGSKAGVDQTITLALNVEFGILTGSVLNEEDAKILSESIKNYSNKILESRSQIGSALNRLESAQKLQNNDIVNLNSSVSTIKDTDIASEATKLTQNQILQQISASLFTQTHGITGNLALRLLGI